MGSHGGGWRQTHGLLDIRGIFAVVFQLGLLWNVWSCEGLHNWTMSMEHGNLCKPAPTPRRYESVSHKRLGSVWSRINAMILGVPGIASCGEFPISRQLNGNPPKMAENLQRASTLLGPSRSCRKPYLE